MIDKLQGIKLRFDFLSEKLAEPDAMADRDAWREMVKERASLEEIVAKFDEYKTVLDALENCKSMLNDRLDSDMKELVRAEIEELEAKREDIYAQLHILLLPKDPNDDRDVILEIRAGTGGDEASLFGADLLRMYLRYAERNGYKVEYLSNNLTDMGGVKEVVLSIGGKRGAYSRLRWTTFRSISRTPTFESTPTAPAALAASTSTKPRAQFALRTCQPAWLSPVRMKNRSSRTKSRPCAC